MVYSDAAIGKHSLSDSCPALLVRYLSSLTSKLEVDAGFRSGGIDHGSGTLGTNPLLLHRSRLSRFEKSCGQTPEWRRIWKQSCLQTQWVFQLPIMNFPEVHRYAASLATSTSDVISIPASPATPMAATRVGPRTVAERSRTIRHSPPGRHARTVRLLGDSYQPEGL